MLIFESQATPADPMRTTGTMRQITLEKPRQCRSQRHQRKVLRVRHHALPRLSAQQQNHVSVVLIGCRRRPSRLPLAIRYTPERRPPPLGSERSSISDRVKRDRGVEALGMPVACAAAVKDRPTLTSNRRAGQTHAVSGWLAEGTRRTARRSVFRNAAPG